MKPIMQFGEAKDSVASVCVGDGFVVAGSVDGKLRRYDLRMGLIVQDIIGRMFIVLFSSPPPLALLYTRSFLHRHFSCIDD